MNLTIERDAALAAISRLNSVVQRKNIIPILSNVALSASGGALRLRTTDLEMESIETVEAVIADGGDTTVPVDKLYDIIRNADAGATIEMKTEDSRLIVKSGRSRFNLPALAIDAFPVFPAMEESASFAMPAALLADMLSRVSWAIEPPPSLRSLSCVYLCNSGHEFHAVGASNAGIALRRTAIPQGAIIAALLPMKLVGHLVKWLSGADGDCRISCTDRLIHVEHGGSTLTGKLFDAEGYVNYLGVLVENQEASLIADRDALGVALRRVGITADDRTGSVRLNISNNALTLATRSTEYGESADEMAADYDGPDHTFLLNTSKLSATAAALQGDRIEISFAMKTDESDINTSKVIVRAPADDGYTSIIMMMRA